MNFVKLAKNRIIAALASIGLVAGGLIATTNAAQAATLPNVSCDTNAKIFDTAWNGSTGVLNSGTDRNWEVGQIINNSGTPFNLASVSPPYSAAQVVTTPPSTKWYAPTGIKYISKVAGANQEPATGWVLNGTNFKSDIFYRFKFTLDGRVDPTTFKLSGNLYADNSIYDIYVNGVSQRGKVANLPSAPVGTDPYTYTGYMSTLPNVVSLPNDWTTGENEVVVQVLSGMAYYGLAGDFSYLAPCSSTIPTLSCTSNPNMFNTAWNGQFGRLTGGTDNYWKVRSYFAADTPTTAPTTGYSPAVVVGTPPTAWAVLSNATWISPNSSGSQTGSTTTTDPTFRSNFFFKYDFNIENGLNPATLSIASTIYADNAVTEIYVNGVAQSTVNNGTLTEIPTGGADPYTYSLGYKSASATHLTLSKNFTAGLNSIVIKVASGMPKLGMAGVFTPTISCATPPPPGPDPITVDKAVATCVGADTPSTVKITGSGFTANSTVTIDSLPAQVNSWTPTELQVALPQGAATGLLDVVVSDGSQSANGTSFYSNACPNTPDPLSVVSAVLTCQNDLPSSLTITGLGMTSNATVEIEGIEATVTSRGIGTVTVDVPEGLSAAPLDVTLIDGSQSYTAEAIYTGICPPTTPPPSIISVQIICDKLNPDTIRITGENFTDATTVEIGGVAATSVTLVSSTELLAKIPAGLPTGLTAVAVIQGNDRADKADAFYNGCVCVDPDGDFDWDNEGDGRPTESPKPKVDLNGDCKGWGWAFGCDNGNHYGYETTQSPDPGGDNDHNIVDSGAPTGASNDGPNSSKANGKVKIKKASVSTIQVQYFSISDVNITHAECPDPSEGVDESTPSPRPSRTSDSDDENESPSPKPSHSYGDDSDDDDYSNVVKCDSPTVPGTPSEEPSEEPKPEKTEAPKTDLNGDCNGYGWAFGCNNGNHYGYETTQTPDPGGDNDHSVVSHNTSAPTVEPTAEPSAPPVDPVVVDPAVAFPAPAAVEQFTPLAKATAKVTELTEKLAQAQAKVTDLRKAKAKPKAVAKAKSTVNKLKKQLTNAKKQVAKLSK